MLLLLAPAIGAAQNEPCLAGTDSADCGIKVSLNPPISSSDQVLQVPNEITVDVPLRLHATKVVVLSGPTGTSVADAFKPLAEIKNFKKVDGNSRFKTQMKDCPGSDNALEVSVYSPRFPYPLTVNIQPFECKQGAPR